MQDNNALELLLSLEAMFNKRKEEAIKQGKKLYTFTSSPIFTPPPQSTT